MSTPADAPISNSADVDHTTTMSRSQQLLLDFLSDHDAECPACGYNLRALTRPICPECKQDLVLKVGALRLRLGWLLVAIAPGFFSGIAACFAAIPTTAVFFEDGVVIVPFVVAVLFGWSSGLFAIILVTQWRTRFIAQSRARQWWFALLIWVVHAAALLLCGALMGPYI